MAFWYFSGKHGNMKKAIVVILALVLNGSLWAQDAQRRDTVDLTAIENMPAKPWSAKKDNLGGGFFAGIGVGSFSHILSGTPGGILEYASAENSTALLAQVGYLFKGGPKSKMSIYESIGYSGLNTTGVAVSSLYRKHFYIKNQYLELKTLPAFNINFKNGSFLALGAGFNMMLQFNGSSYVHVDNSAGGYNDMANPKFKKVFACPVGEISYHGKRVILSVHYQQSGNAVEYANESWSVHRLAGGISYKF